MEMATSTLLEAAEPHIKFHLCKIWPLCPLHVACGWKFFARKNLKKKSKDTHKHARKFYIKKEE